MGQPKSFLSPSQYQNSDQRNVHVWCSLNVEGDPSHSRRIVAGCYNNPNNSIRVDEFFEWLHYFLGVNCSRELGRDNTKFNAATFPCTLCSCSDPQDPQTSFPPPNASFPNRYYSQEAILDVSDVACHSRILPRGHYYLLERNMKHAGTYRSHHTGIGLLDFPAITSRTKSMGTGTRTSEGHSEVTRKEVRTRDQKCRVLGQRAHARARGTNFTGLEVAHINPIGWIDKAGDVFDYNHPCRKLLATKTSADTPCNALLLRTDVHAYFDDYQIGIHKPKYSDDYRVYHFEQGGAPGIQNEIRYLHPPTKINKLHPEARGSIPDCHPALLLHHFKTALLWHVAGVGHGYLADFHAIASRIVLLNQAGSLQGAWKHLAGD